MVLEALHGLVPRNSVGVDVNEIVCKVFDSTAAVNLSEDARALVNPCWVMQGENIFSAAACIQDFYALIIRWALTGVCL